MSWIDLSKTWANKIRLTAFFSVNIIHFIIWARLETCPFFSSRVIKLAPHLCSKVGAWPEKIHFLPFAHSFLGTCPPVRVRPTLAAPAIYSTASAEHYASFVLLSCWQLWKRRNGFIFRQEMISMHLLLCLRKEDAKLWRHILLRSSMGVTQQWCTLFPSAL